jgi:hypothetical protein
MKEDTTRLTLDVPSDLHGQVKMMAARKKTSMREYCVQAIEHRLREEKADYLTAEEAPLLAELWDNEEDAVYDDL